ncbi:MAG: hypothetical protein IKQ54_07950 [Oscillospiraceae bacterium]|nr:hypothetical protein [Oscillospiraceae bacterium]
MPNPIRPRCSRPEDSGLPALNGELSYVLKQKMDEYLFDQFGIRLDKDKNAPLSAGIVPRILVMCPDSRGDDFPMNVNDTPYKPGTEAFFRQVMMGNVFVYPAGQTKPVQLQLEEDTGKLRWTHSEPVEPEQLPAAPVRPLTGWRWLARKLLRFPFRQQHRAWLKAQQDRANAAAKLEDYAVGRSTVAQRETEELNAEKERIANAKALKEAKDKVDQAEKGKQQFVSVFKPTPDKRNDFLKHEENHPLGANYAYYTEKNFRDLTILTTDEDGVRQRLKQQDDQNEQKLKDEIRERGLPENQTQKLHPDQRAGQDYKFRHFDQNSVRIGGKPLTDAQFAAVALAACFQDDLIRAGKAVDPLQYDPTVEESLRLAGYPQHDCVKLAHMSARSMGTTDLFITKPGPRDGGGQSIKSYVNPGRLAAADAFDAYRNGDIGPLAMLMANGVNQFGCDFNDFSGTKIPDQTRGTILMSKELLELFEQDSRLKDVAVKSYNMDEKKLELLKGMVKIQGFEQKSHEAEYQMIKARQEGKTLSKEQKKQLAKQIVMSKLAGTRLMEHAKNIETDPNSAYNRFMTETNFVNPPPSVERPGFPQEKYLRQMPVEPGSIYLDNTNDLIGGVRMLYSPIPSFPGKLNDPKEMEKFEKYAENIVANEHLADIENDLEFYKKVSPVQGTLNITDAVTRYNQKLEQQKQAGGLQNAPQKLVQPAEPKLGAQNMNGPEAQQQILP